MKAFLRLLATASVLVVPITGLADQIAQPPPPTVLDCRSTPDVSITSSKATYEVVGTCDKISVAGSGSTIAIEAVKNLSITGSKNEITVARVDKIAAMGANNRVTYGAGLTIDAPKIASMGKGNVIQRGAAPGPATKTMPPELDKKLPGATLAPPTDCAEAPTHRILDNHVHQRFIGPCESITIAGNHATVSIERAKSVVVAGNHSAVSITAVGKLSVQGNDNRVSWHKGLTAAKAKVAVTGKRNAITQSK
jgi:hypothetical protein